MNQPQAGPFRAAEGVGGNFNEEQVAQIIIAALRQPREAPEEQRCTIERASNLRAKPYDGSGDPEAALLWLDRVSKIYRVMGCTDEQRLLFSSFLMEDRVKDWWEALERKTRSRDGRPYNKRSGPSSSQSGFNQTSRKKSKTKWTGGKGTYRGAAFSQGLVRSAAAPGASRPTFPKCSICKRRHPGE
ncbi:hypothetical protein JRO89_XS04G0133600 [Xanthoceras sorbifolium]|uniref:Zinc finger, CCHC-type, retrotransposon Gag domain protein n=1 Tax=Xanthoceras sorbifolium TaxID=99658 RepID=A0ABQ8I547_9ROSI|nr:hypothetical protein JRO89_XS04G0133600 [Xanthoceras sorbifolium]